MLLYGSQVPQSATVDVEPILSSVLPKEEDGESFPQPAGHEAQPPLAADGLQKKMSATAPGHLQQKRVSKLQCYLALNRQHRAVDYLSNVTNQKLRKTLINEIKKLDDHKSEHKLAIEIGCHRKSWQPRENRLTQFCQQDVETEQHCSLFKDIRIKFFSNIKLQYQEYNTFSDQRKD